MAAWRALLLLRSVPFLRFNGGGIHVLIAFYCAIARRLWLRLLHSSLCIPRPPDGFFLGEYKILDRIGKGQMGSVYKAIQIGRAHV